MAMPAYVAQVNAAKAMFALPRTLLLLADDELAFERTFPRGKGKGETATQAADVGTPPRTLYAVYSAGVGQLTVETHIEKIRDYTSAAPKTKKDDKVLPFPYPLHPRGVLYISRCMPCTLPCSQHPCHGITAGHFGGVSRRRHHC